MAKKTKELNPLMTGRQLTVMFVALLIAHSIVIYLANQWFPSLVVLGTNIYSPMAAIVYSMVLFTLIVVGATPVIEHVGNSMSRKLSDMDWMVLFVLINAGGLWLVARFAEQLGLGVASWMVVAILAVIMDVVQGLTMKVLMSIVE